MTACDTLPPPKNGTTPHRQSASIATKLWICMEFCNSITILHGILYTLSKIILNFVSTKKHIIKI